MNSITQRDRYILRELAREYMAAAASDSNINLQREWLMHNTFRGERPMIHLEMWGFEQEVLPPLLQCEGEQARDMEIQMRRLLFHRDVLQDDRPLTPYFSVFWHVGMHLFGVEPCVAADNGRGGGQAIHAVIEDLSTDFHKLGKSSWGVNREASLWQEALAQETFGDILPVRRVMNSLYAVPTQDVVHLMGMENMLYAMCDYPDLFSTMMNRIAEDYIAYFKWLEAEKLLLPTAGGEILNQGSFCYTDALPSESPKEGLLTQQVWGFMDSQESVSISPAMFEELIFPCYEKIAKVYGLLSYGCCEPINAVWDGCVSKLENLRKVSISPWCDEVMMGDRLRGRQIIYQRKPSPNFLGVGNTLDEEALRRHIEATLQAAKGCTLELTQRDVYTLNGDIRKAGRYVEILRETIDSNWQP